MSDKDTKGAQAFEGDSDVTAEVGSTRAADALAEPDATKPLSASDETQGGPKADPHSANTAAGDASAAPAGGSKRPNNLLMGVLALCCVALIGLSAFALLNGGTSPEPSGASLAASASAGSASTDSAAGADEDAAAAQDDPAEDGSSSSDDAGENDGSNTKTSSSKTNSTASNDSNSDSHGGSSSAGDSSDKGAGKPSGSGAGNANSSGNAGDSGDDARDTITVSVLVDSSAADGSVSGSGTYTLEAGATPFDALKALTSSIEYSTSGMGVYVEAIGGLRENDSRFSGTTGWKYSVNGEVIMQSCSSYALHDGDTVVWYYTVTG